MNNEFSYLTNPFSFYGYEPQDAWIGRKEQLIKQGVEPDFYVEEGVGFVAGDPTQEPEQSGWRISVESDGLTCDVVAPKTAEEGETVEFSVSNVEFLGAFIGYAVFVVDEDENEYFSRTKQNGNNTYSFEMPNTNVIITISGYNW
ncbi:MAG: hypothetical protein J6X18_16175 [Bacteroidales bacterium]|nr:hypothetical protein [Bacteroidales bacterium]